MREAGREGREGGRKEGRERERERERRQVGYTPGNDGSFFMCAEDLAQTVTKVICLTINSA
jgi:hypothetical protein